MKFSLAPNSRAPTPTPELPKSFKECKVSLSSTTLFAHPDSSAPLTLVTGASTSAIGALLQRRAKNAWQPLAFSRKLNLGQQKYSAYDRELFANYESVKEVKHSRLVLEVHHLIIVTDHKPITYAFQQKQD
jgi:hypothetical protein